MNGFIITNLWPTQNTLMVKKILTLFPMAAHQESKGNLLISQPYRNWKDARSDLSHHAVLQYHKDSMEALNSFVSCFQNPNRRLSIWNYTCKTLCSLKVFKMKIDLVFLKIPIVFSSLFKVIWTISSKY